MKGTHRVIVQNKRIRYDFEVKRNITIIKGDSATGKTALVDMIRENYENGSSSGVELTCDKECTVLEGRSWKPLLSSMKDSIIFIDEGNEFVMSKEFASLIRSTDNYYVIVTREGIPSLPYSVDEIYGIRNSGKYGTLKQTYNEFYHIYQSDSQGQFGEPDRVITEDSNAGFHFFENLCKRLDRKIDCVSAQGKSNVFSTIVKMSDSNILVIADGAAFGSEMEKMMQYIKDHPNVKLYLPESFEWIILKSGLIEDGEVYAVLKQPQDYIDSEKYFSWERFFTAYLIQQTQHTYLQYSKNHLNPVYLQDHETREILNAMEGIQWI